MKIINQIELFGVCACTGCNNLLEEDDDIHCKECAPHIVFVDDPATPNEGWFYCALHERPPTEETKIEYLLLTKQYLKK